MPSLPRRFLPVPGRGSFPAFPRRVPILLIVVVGALHAQSPDQPLLSSFRAELEPVLQNYCYDCHGDGMKKGGVRLDGFTSDADLRDHSLWLRAFNNVRTGIMPPADNDRLEPEDKEAILQWIKQKAFALDPANPDPGKVTMRRLNRVEYRNTLRDLLGVDFDTDAVFPADDSGHGFDNIADVLTISPMLMEKYVDAAQAVVEKAVPMQSRVVAEHRIPGRDLRSVYAAAAVGDASTLNRSGSMGESVSSQPGAAPQLTPQEGTIENEALDLLYYAPALVSTKLTAHVDGQYELAVDLKSIERYVDNLFDYNTCRLVIRADSQVLLDQAFVREGNRDYRMTFDLAWSAGVHEVSFELIPTTFDLPQHRKLRIRLHAVTLRGPLAEEHWVQPRRHAEFFPGLPPIARTEREAYARQVLAPFAARAFRRPVDADLLDRLVSMAMAATDQPGTPFEAAVAQAMVAVLASPRFLFREDHIEPLGPGETFAQIDEYSLASRLSYFLWSSMPDAELFELASRRELRRNLRPQVRRMLEDGRSQAFVKNFTGQWLQARDITTISIDALTVFLREHPNPELEAARETFRRLVQIDEEKRTPEDQATFDEARKTFFSFIRQPRPQLTDSLRHAMQRETEMLFDHVLKDGRSVLDLLNADYAHLNEELAAHYGIEGVKGTQMRKVPLPEGSVRGGVLTQGTVLTVTSNPTRTSPVKRGVFILDNILGAPPPPPPPNIPPLEEAGTDAELKKLTLRETLALHAKKPMCASCHSRMDPLGLALESFNALGRYREAEMDLPIDPSGTLMSGESFTDVRELKRVLVTQHRQAFFHCLAEKLLTYALGRGLEFYDVQTLDHLVAELEANDGRLESLVLAVIESVPFQKRRPENAVVVENPVLPPTHSGPLADLRPPP